MPVTSGCCRLGGKWIERVNSKSRSSDRSTNKRIKRIRYRRCREEISKLVWKWKKEYIYIFEVEGLVADALYVQSIISSEMCFNLNNVIEFEFRSNIFPLNWFWKKKTEESKLNLRNKERDSRVRNETNIQSEPNETFRKIDAKIEANLKRK